MLEATSPSEEEYRTLNPQEKVRHFFLFIHFLFCFFFGKKKDLKPYDPTSHLGKNSKINSVTYSFQEEQTSDGIHTEKSYYPELNSSSLKLPGGTYSNSTSYTFNSESQSPDSQLDVFSSKLTSFSVIDFLFFFFQQSGN